jgi:hypothetical protein
MAQRNPKLTNKNFVQHYRDTYVEMRWLARESVIAHDVFLFILEKMDKKNALVCSAAVFEDYFGKSRSSIYRAIKLLYDNGFVNIVKSNTTNVYIANPKVVWTSWDDGKQYAQFDAVTLISYRENKDYDSESQFKKFSTIRQRHNICESAWDEKRINGVLTLVKKGK